MKPHALFLGLSIYNGNRCLSCQLLTLGSRQTVRTISKPTAVRPQPSPLIEEQGGKGDKKDEFKPVALQHPLGLIDPPQEGENTGIDKRTFGQRRRDLVDPGKNLQHRKQLVKSLSKPYFRDFLRTRYYQGKTFIANPRPIRSDKALYFPNLYGRTLRTHDPLQNTTTILRGKISVVSVFATLWAERQTLSFLGAQQNPTLHALINSSTSITQRLDLNVESNWAKAWMLRLFVGSIRRKLPEEQHGRYFLINQGFSESLKLDIGMMNEKVGYVYLLDEECRIRWAGSGMAMPEELTSLNNSVERLIEQSKVSATSPVSVLGSAKASTPGEEEQKKTEPILA